MLRHVHLTWGKPWWGCGGDYKRKWHVLFNNIYTHIHVEAKQQHQRNRGPKDKCHAPQRTSIVNSNIPRVQQPSNRETRASNQCSVAMSATDFHSGTPAPPMQQAHQKWVTVTSSPTDKLGTDTWLDDTEVYSKHQALTVLRGKACPMFSSGIYESSEIFSVIWLLDDCTLTSENISII